MGSEMCIRDSCNDDGECTGGKYNTSIDDVLFIVPERYTEEEKEIERSN